MPRCLSLEERALWARVVESVRPLHAVGSVSRPAPSTREARSVQPGLRVSHPLSPRQPAAGVKPGANLDGSWDRRLGRGVVQPEMCVDLHGHNLATAYALLDNRLDQAIKQGVRILLLITGKPPGGELPVARGRIRAAVGDWLAASRHAGDIAAVRNAHPRHGGAGALYIVFRRQRVMQTK